MSFRLFCFCRELPGEPGIVTAKTRLFQGAPRHVFFSRGGGQIATYLLLYGRPIYFLTCRYEIAAQDLIFRAVQTQPR